MTDARLPDEAIARIAYEAVRAHQAECGDPVNPPWGDSGPPDAAEAVAVCRAEPDPVVRHDAWMRRRVAEGWTWGAVKDPAALTHPWLVPYCDLPARARARGRLYAAIVTALG